MGGVEGYNNGVGLLDTIVSECYLNPEFSKMSGRNLKFSDLYPEKNSIGANWSAYTTTSMPKVQSCAESLYEKYPTYDEIQEKVFDGYDSKTPSKIMRWKASLGKAGKYNDQATLLKLWNDCGMGNQFLSSRFRGQAWHDGNTDPTNLTTYYSILHASNGYLNNLSGSGYYHLVRQIGQEEDFTGGEETGVVMPLLIFPKSTYKLEKNSWTATNPYKISLK